MADDEQDDWQPVEQQTTQADDWQPVSRTQAPAADDWQPVSHQPIEAANAPDNPYGAATDNAQEEPGALGAAARGLARAAPSTAAGLLGGAATGAIAGSIFPGLGTIGGAIVGGIGGLGSAYLAEKAGAGEIAEKLGLDSPEQRAADIRAHPTAEMAGELGSALVGLSPGRLGTSIAHRLASGGLMGFVDLGQQAATKGWGNIDPTELALAGGVGAALPEARPWLKGAAGGAARFFERTPGAVAPDTLQRVENINQGADVQAAMKGEQPPIPGPDVKEGPSTPDNTAEKLNREFPTYQPEPAQPREANIGVQGGYGMTTPEAIGRPANLNYTPEEIQTTPSLTPEQVEARRAELAVTQAPPMRSERGNILAPQARDIGTVEPPPALEGREIPPPGEAPPTPRAPLTPEAGAPRPEIPEQPGTVREATPAEDQAVAAMQQRSLGAAGTPELSTAPEPPVGAGARPLTLPEKQTPGEYAANQFQEKARIDQKEKEYDVISAIDRLRAAAGDKKTRMNVGTLEKLFTDLENGRKLLPEHQGVHDRGDFQGIRDELHDFYEDEIAGGRMKDMGQTDPNYMPKVTEKQWARETGEARQSNADPIAGNMRFMRKNPPREGDYMAIRDSKGNERIISTDPDSDNFHVWDKGNATQVPNNTEIVNGSKVQFGGKDWTVVPAKTEAIEAAGVKDYQGDPVKFVKSPATLIRALVQKKEIERNRAMLDHVQTDPAYDKVRVVDNGTQARRNFIRDNGWIESDIPELRGTYFEPNMAHALNDFHQPGFNIDLGGVGRGMAAINRFLTGSIFWNPIPHLFNTGYHWFVGRGGDWLVPPAYMRLASTGIQAIKEVVTQGPLYRQLLNEGTTFMWPAIDSRNMMQAIGKLGEVAIKQDPTTWNTIARTMGLQSAADLTKLWYDGARRVLWQGGDIFAMQRVLENMQKGMSPQDAITATRTHLPDYTIPFKVMGSRAFAQLLADPRNPLSVFNRYHYGMFKSLAKITNDTVMPNVPWEMRKEAIGNALALATLGFVIKPGLDAMWQKITGNKEAEARPRGPLAPIFAAKELIQGKRDVASALGTAMTMSPFMRVLTDTFTDRDWKGKTIITPGAGPLQQMSQLAGHAASYIAPINTFGEAFNPKSAKGSFTHELAAQLGDYKAPTEKQIKGQKKGEKLRKQEAKQRLKKPENVVEYWLNKAAGYQEGGLVQPDYKNAENYDYAAAIAAGEGPDVRGHMTDKYKLPTHITFSTGSQYSGQGGEQGGTWDKLPAAPGTAEENQPWMFTPGTSNMKYYTPQEQQSYFQQYEPSSLIRLPDPRVVGMARGGPVKPTKFFARQTNP